jgi:uridylate kinase
MDLLPERGALCHAQNPGAKMHKRLLYGEVTAQNLRVMDETAITLCKENKIPVRLPDPIYILHQM